MLVSNDYVIRSMGSNITQVPEDKNDVNDDNFESILKKIGSHQVFLDFSRCLNITPKSFYLLEMCKSLLYLDVSYTSIADLSVISNNCAVLKGLNLAGTKLQYHSHTNSNSNSYINNTYINNSNNSNSYTRTCNNNNSTRRSYPLKNSDIKGKKSLITSSSTLNTNSNPDSSDSITNSIDSSTNKQNSDPFETLSNLLTLEILSARNTEFNNLEILLPLICLRSLDLGKTKIKHINNIDILYRLEELLLDCNYDLYTISNCNSDVGNSCDNSTIGDSRQLLSLHDKNKVLTSFSKLSKLKVLNVQDTVLLPLKDNIQNVLHPDAYIEHKTRRALFFEAVVTNNATQVYHYLCNGQDINERAGPEDEEYFIEVYKQRCQYKKLKAPFILCTHEIDSLRPSAIHLGIIFNSYDSIRVLLDNNIDKTSVCWFDEILIKSKFSVDNKDNGITDNLSTENMFIDYEKIQKRLEGELSEVVSTDKILNSKRSCIDLINEVYKRNVHRLTDNMIFRKVAEWKNVLSRYKNGLTVLINARRASYRINYEDIPFDMALDGPSQDPNDISMQNRDEENDDDELASNTNYNTSMGMIQTSRSPTALKLSMQTSKSGGRFSRVSSKKLLRADSSDPFYIPPRTVNRKQLVPKRITRYPWRNHVMVVKLEGKPLLLPRISKETEFLPSRSMSNPNSPSHRKPNTIENIIAASYETNKAKERNNGNVAEDGDVSSEESVEEEKPTYLGKYSYWMESYGQTIAARERELDLLYGTYDSMPYQVSLNRRLNDFDRATGHGKRFGRNEVLDVLVDDNVMDSSSNANSSSNLNTPMASRSHDIHGLKPNEGLTVDIRSPNLASRTLGLSYDSKVNTPKLSTPKRKEMFLKELNVRNEIKYLPRDDDDVY